MHLALTRLDRRLRAESWRINPCHRDPESRAEYMTRVRRHLADAVRALEGMS